MINGNQKLFFDADGPKYSDYYVFDALLLIREKLGVKVQMHNLVQTYNRIDTISEVQLYLKSDKYLNQQSVEQPIQNITL